MTQHFLLSAQARTLSVAKVARMSDEEARGVFRKIRWAETDRPQQGQGTVAIKVLTRAKFDRFSRCPCDHATRSLRTKARDV